MNNKFYFVSDDETIESEDIENNRKENDFNDEIPLTRTSIEIPLFNPNLSISENLETGIKYFLLPINSNEFGYYDNRRFIHPGTKVMVNPENYDLLECSEMMYTIIDYATMFGVRLNRFINYNPNFFVCDERVFFESLMMKYRYFECNKFFLSYPSIWKEIGIKKDRAISIRKKFESLGILETVVEGNMISSGPSQVTYYILKPEKIIELLPNIYIEIDSDYDLEKTITDYLLGKNK